MIYYALSALVVAGIALVFYWKGMEDASIKFGQGMAMWLDKDGQKRFVELIDSARERLKQDDNMNSESKGVN